MITKKIIRMAACIVISCAFGNFASAFGAISCHSSEEVYSMVQTVAFASGDQGPAISPGDDHFSMNNPSTYYVDATLGNDQATGTSTSQAWATLVRVNAATFQPGDTILFKCGETWIGSLSPKGSGKPGLPIVISKYGEGERPKIDGNGMTDQGVLYFENQSGWVISNLEITNDAPSGGIRRGVEICGRNGGVLTGFHLKNLHVHHIRGLIGNSMTHKSTGGIFFSVYEDGQVATRFDNLIVEDCEIHDCDNQGIVTSGNTTYPDPFSALWNAKKFTNVVIRKNVIYNISKNAMILRLLDGGLVERNLCYSTATGTTGNTIFTRSSRRVILQYNEGYDNQSPDHDGSLYDADLESVECIFQYSYSHDNAHGLYWQCTVQKDYGNIIRYNISQNDKGRIFNFSYPSNGTMVYNNTVYIGSHRSPVIIGEKTLYNGKRYYAFKNNLIINESPGASYIWVDNEYIGKRDFSNNLFYGNHPSGEPLDLNKVIDDPLLIGAGTGEDIDHLEGYRLQEGSPAIDAGADISNNGGMDIFGNPVSELSDIGAVEYQGAVSMNTSADSGDKNGVFLNTTTNELKLFISSLPASSCNIELINLQGKVLEKFQRSTFDKEHQSTTLVLKNPLHPGIYFINVKTNHHMIDKQAFVVL